MLTRIAFCVLAISPMVGLCDDFKYNKHEISRRITYEDGFIIRVIAEKHQSVEKGLKFTVELENKLNEPVGFWALKKDASVVTVLNENYVPFQYSIIPSTEKFNVPTCSEDGTCTFRLGHESDLASYNDSNIGDLSVKFTRRIDIDANSTMQLGSVEFSNYFVRNEEKEGVVQLTEKTINFGTYIIKATLPGFLIVNSDGIEIETNMNTVFNVNSEQIEVTLD